MNYQNQLISKQLLTFYLRVRSFSYAKNTVQQHKIHSQLTKKHSLQTETKKSSSFWKMDTWKQWKNGYFYNHKSLKNIMQLIIIVFLYLYPSFYPWIDIISSYGQDLNLGLLLYRCSSLNYHSFFTWLPPPTPPLIRNTLLFLLATQGKKRSKFEWNYKT